MKIKDFAIERYFAKYESPTKYMLSSSYCDGYKMKYVLDLASPTFEFAEKLVKETGIMLLPAETFEYGKSHARIGFGRKNFPEILHIFQDYITKHYS
ncbi:hypothetical protein V6R21_03770 [Limibacter armeniacum]|uniref:hypothetical protein n=1 Tax=Limibacter armeniacum TaxID=466084 RepID=UPI002FE64E85